MWYSEASSVLLVLTSCVAINIIKRRVPVYLIVLSPFLLVLARRRYFEGVLMFVHVSFVDSVAVNASTNPPHDTNSKVYTCTVLWALFG